MVVDNIKRHARGDYTGEVAGTKVILVFENCIPTEGKTIKVTSGKMITKNNQNYYYVREYQGE